MDVAAAIAVLKTERHALDRVLRDVPEYRRLMAVDISIAALEPAYNSDPSQILADQSYQLPIKPSNGPDPEKRQRLKVDSQAASVCEWAEALFRETNRRQQSPGLATEFQSRGWSIFAPNKSGYIASTLSHDNRFNNANDAHGKGYGLREWSTITSTASVDSEPHGTTVNQADSEIAHLTSHGGAL